jgi:endonuclease V-like protein UPF0215 family
MNIHAHKKGIRALGISESFVKHVSKYSVLAGVVIRADLIVDGFSFAKTTVGGMDATDSVLRLYKGLVRKDINVLLLNGCVISWYNVIDLNRVSEELDLPLICVTYEESSGIESYFKEYFPNDWQDRVKIYYENGSREPLVLHTGHKIFVRSFKINKKDTENILNKFTLNGAIPEPLRIARLLARALIRSI